MDNATVEPVFAELALAVDLSADDDHAIGADGDAVPYTDDYPGRGRRLTPPAGLIGSAVAAIDFLWAVSSAAFVSILYVHFSDATLAKSPHYAATALIGAVILVGLFERLGGYQLKRLQSLKWQVPHITLVWSIGVAILLLAAFVGKISSDYSRGWALLWFLATPLILIAARATELTVLGRRLNDGSLAERSPSSGRATTVRDWSRRLAGAPIKASRSAVFLTTVALVVPVKFMGSRWSAPPMTCSDFRVARKLMR